MLEAIRQTDICLPSWDDVTELTGLTGTRRDRRFPSVARPARGCAEARQGRLVHRDARRAARRAGPRRAMRSTQPARATASAARSSRGMVEGDDPFEAARYANVAAALSTQGYGAVAPIPSRAAVEHGFWRAERHAPICASVDTQGRAKANHLERLNEERAMQRDVVVVSGVRTAIGGFGGSLKDFPPTDLGARVVREALARANVSGDEVGHVVFGNVIHTEPKDMYLARVAAINGGVAQHTPALTVNRLCGSGLQAIVSARAMHPARRRRHRDRRRRGEHEPRHPTSMPAARFGARMGDATLDRHDGRRAERSVRQRPHGRHRRERRDASTSITREAAGRARRRERTAARRSAIDAGYFKEQILPIEIKSRRKATLVFDTDEHVRARRDASRGLAKLKAGVREGNGTVTAGNASGINDAAAAVVLMERSDGRAARRCKPMARLVAYAHAGVDPKFMGIGPVPAAQGAGEGRAEARRHRRDRGQRGVRRAGAGGQPANWSCDPAKVNPNGSGISLGHPIGATGAHPDRQGAVRVAAHGGRYALVTMCIGGGQGIAAIFEIRALKWRTEGVNAEVHGSIEVKQECRRGERRDAAYALLGRVSVCRTCRAGGSAFGRARNGRRVMRTRNRGEARRARAADPVAAQAEPRFASSRAMWARSAPRQIELRLGAKTDEPSGIQASTSSRAPVK